MRRRFWRRYREVSIRSSQDLTLRYNSTKSLAICLGQNGEVDAASQLLDDASPFVGNNRSMLLELKLLRADLRIQNGQKLEALGLLQAMLPEAKVCTGNPHIYCRTMQQLASVLIDLDRDQEAHEATSELVAFAKANYSLENLRTLIAMKLYAAACAKVGRVEEAKANFEDLLPIETRILGREHRLTQTTWDYMRLFGFAAPSG